MASSSAVPEEFAPFVPKRDAPKPKEQDQRIIVSVPADKIKKIHVKSLALARPAGLEEMRVRELQADCDRWGIAVSGSKSEVLLRLRRLYGGEMVLQKGCATRYVQLIPEPLSTAAAPTGSRTSTASAGRMPMTAPAATGTTTATASAGRMPMTAPTATRTTMTTARAAAAGYGGGSTAAMPSTPSMPQSSGKMAFREEAGGNRQAEGPLVDPRTGVVRVRPTGARSCVSLLWLQHGS